MDSKESKSFKLFFPVFSMYPPLQKEEEDALRRQVKEGRKEAGDKLVLHNQKLVLCLARRVYYALHPYQQTLVEILDLIQAGNIGLLAAIQNDDPLCAGNFQAYLGRSIKWSIIRSVLWDYFNIRRVPKSARKAYGAYRRLVDTLAIIYGKVDMEESLAIFSGNTLREMEQKTDIEAHPIALDAGDCENDDKNNTYMEIIHGQHLDESAIFDCVDMLKKLFPLAMLDSAEEHIIYMRFGIIDGVPKTLREVGRALNLSAPQVSQIEQMIIRKLRRAYRKLLIPKWESEQASKSDEQTACLAEDEAKAPKAYRENGVNRPLIERYSYLFEEDTEFERLMEFAGLTEQEKYVIRARLGRGEDKKRYSIKELCQTLGISTAKIRNIQKEAIKAMDFEYRNQKLLFNDRVGRMR